MSPTRDRLTRLFEERDDRHDYTESFFDTLIAAQIRALREERGWTQANLGEKSGTTQSGISAFESSDYSRWSVRTLRRFARAFDVALIVKLASFGEALRMIEDFDSSAVQVPDYSHDSSVAPVGAALGSTDSENEWGTASLLAAPRSARIAIGGS